MKTMTCSKNKFINITIKTKTKTKPKLYIQMHYLPLYQKYILQYPRNC